MMLQNSRIEREGWHQLMKAFGFAFNAETYDALIHAYSEKHRFYHTLDHIAACFYHLEVVAQQAIYPHEIELALWFHDAVYKLFSSSNEEDSAELAKQFLLQNDAEPEVTDRIYDLIILTKDHIAPTSTDAKIMLDIDLSILGTEKHIYAQFEKDVRKEYKYLPSFIFKKKRKNILQSFIGRPRIYHTSYFTENFEHQAQKNLAWAILQL